MVPTDQGGTSGIISKTANSKKGGNLMNGVIHRDSDRLTVHAERIKQGLERLEQDCSAWARKREEKDLGDLMEDLQRIEMDVSLMLTDCISAGCQCGEEAPKVVFHDFREVFGCLDTLFNGLKKARLQLDRAYIHSAILDHLEIDYGRFRKLIGKVQRHLNAQKSQTPVPLEGSPVHLAQGHAATV
jgi:hypothetical protein